MHAENAALTAQCAEAATLREAERSALAASLASEAEKAQHASDALAAEVAKVAELKQALTLVQSLQDEAKAASSTAAAETVALQQRVADMEAAAQRSAENHAKDLAEAAKGGSADTQRMAAVTHELEQARAALAEALKEAEATKHKLDLTAKKSSEAMDQMTAEMQQQANPMLCTNAMLLCALARCFPVLSSGPDSQ